MIYIISTNLAKFRSNFIKISAKNDEINGNFGKKSEIFRNLGAEFLQNFEFGAVQRFLNLVDLEKCCKMRIWTQKSASIQQRTSPLKFGDLAEKS